MNQSIKSKGQQAFLLFLMLQPILSFGQNAGQGTTSYFSNSLFLSLLVLIIVLLIVIVSLSTALKNLSQSDYLFNKLKEESKNDNEKKSSTGKVIGLILLMVFLGEQLSAQSATQETNKWLIGGLNYFTIFFMGGIILLELICIVCLVYMIKRFAKTGETEAVKPKIKVKEITLLEALSDAVEIENEHEILMDHDYDGIKELDNNLPPWWKYGFYLTIFVAVVYMINYHGAKTGNLQAAEYDNEMAEAKAQIEEYMKTAANNVDETTVKMLDNQSDLAAGKDIFVGTCSACHGKLGEGGVGPNMTDDYWIYSGGIADIFKTIKYGKPDKGMKSWKEDLSPMQIAQVASYIKTLRGTNPPKGKAPQGDLYTEGPVAPADSLKSAVDTLNVKDMVIDSLKVKK